MFKSLFARTKIHKQARHVDKLAFSLVGWDTALNRRTQV